MDSIEIGGRRIGPGEPVYIIAEAGLNHNGSPELACRLIDVAATARADVVKFQKREVDHLAIGPVLDAADERFPAFGSTYRQIREHLEFGEQEYRRIQVHCAARGIPFLCTAFDIQSADFLERLGVDAYKLASHSLTNLPLVEHVADKGKPVILSTGMCTMEEIDQAVALIREHHTPLLLMHCVSAYPTPPEQCNLGMIAALRERYQVPVGYSGHELGYAPTLAAVAQGACAIERHFTLDSSLPGFDHRISLEPDALFRMVRDIRQVSASLLWTEKAVSDTEMVTRRKYHVSIVAEQAIPAGTVITRTMLGLRNPGTGLPARRIAEVVGKRACRDIAADTLIDLTMVQ